VTDAEAIKALRELLPAVMATGDHHEVEHVLSTVGEIVRDGCDPVIELRIRRFRRLYGDCCPGNGRAVRHS
jgi:hypothetical protein